MAVPALVRSLARRPGYNVDLKLEGSASSDASMSDTWEALVRILARIKLGYNLEVLMGSVPSGPSITDICLQHARIVFSTVCSSVNARGVFDCAIIDEASQLVEAETLVVTQRPLKQLVLVGDHKQLPACVISQVAQQCGYDRSLFDWLQILEFPSKMLKVSTGCTQTISRFSIDKFYGGKVENGAIVQGSSYSDKVYQKTLFRKYSFIDINGKEESGPGGRGWRNPAEVEAVMYLVTKLQKVLQQNKTTATVALVSPYKAHVQALTKWLAEKPGRFPSIEIQVKTVDGFQGRKTDIIIFSAVRANSAGKVGFLSDNRRLNVAITRAKYCMWIVRNEDTLRSNEVWRLLITDARTRNCVLHQSQDAHLEEAVEKALSSNSSSSYSATTLSSYFDNMSIRGRGKRGQQSERGQRTQR